MKGTFKITAEISSSENGKKIASMLQNLISSVDEKNLLELSKEVEKNPSFFSKVLKIIENPMVKKFFK